MLWFGYGVAAEIGPLVGLGLYATSYTLQSYTQHGKKYMRFSQQLNLTLACLKENLVSLFERKHTTNIIFEFDTRVGCRVGCPV